jgi:predicted nucleic acid-binding protein
VSYLLDTNVVSELRKKNCSKNVRAFIEKIPAEQLYISAVSIGEISQGIELLEDTQKRVELSRWLENELPRWFDNRIISLDSTVMAFWGVLCAKAKRTLPVLDSLIAASALYYHLTLVTRNIKDFPNIAGLTLINPWE